MTTYRSALKLTQNKYFCKKLWVPSLFKCVNSIGIQKTTKKKIFFLSLYCLIQHALNQNRFIKMENEEKRMEMFTSQNIFSKSQFPFERLDGLVCYSAKHDSTCPILNLNVWQLADRKTSPKCVLYLPQITQGQRMARDSLRGPWRPCATNPPSAKLPPFAWVQVPK